MRKDIFEDVIAHLEECHYISDLRNMLNKKGYLKILSIVENFEYQDYPVNQWKELIEYILQEKVNFTDSEEAYHYLIKRLKK